MILIFDFRIDFVKFRRDFYRSFEKKTDDFDQSLKKNYDFD